MKNIGLSLVAIIGVVGSLIIQYQTEQKVARLNAELAQSVKNQAGVNRMLISAVEGKSVLTQEIKWRKK